jgi:hypothetical protein
MAGKRSRTKNAAGVAPSAGGSAGLSPIATALIIVLALGYGLRSLVVNGRVNWPPDHLLDSLATVAGCLAIVGPILLLRRTGQSGVGDLVWLTGGLLIWVFDLVGLAGGDWRSIQWTTPLSPRIMGLMMLALMIAAFRRGSGGESWSWTNVVGWSLGLFWVASAFISLAPTCSLLVSLR